MPFDPQPFMGPLAVTLAYVILYYATMINLMRTKSRLSAAYAARGEKFDRYFGNDREMLAADRVQLNMLEHMPPFLVLLWLHALFVSPTSATIAGVVYVAARAAYPLTLGSRVGRGIRGLVLASTVPGYLVVLYLTVGLVWAMVR